MSKKALVSVWDKTGIVEFCRLLVDRKFEVILCKVILKVIDKSWIFR